MSETIATEKAVFEAADRLTALKKRVSILTIQEGHWWGIEKYYRPTAAPVARAKGRHSRIFAGAAPAT